MGKLRVITLDPDFTLTVENAEKRDGFLATPTGAVDLSSPLAVFPMSKPVRRDMADLYTIPTPVRDMSDTNQAVIRFGNDYGYVGDFTESLESKTSRDRRSTLVLGRMARANAIKGAPKANEQGYSDEFKLLSIGIIGMGVLGILFVALSVLFKGAP